MRCSSEKEETESERKFNTFPKAIRGWNSGPCGTGIVPPSKLPQVSLKAGLLVPSALTGQQQNKQTGETWKTEVLQQPHLLQNDDSQGFWIRSVEVRPILEHPSGDYVLKFEIHCAFSTHTLQKCTKSGFLETVPWPLLSHAQVKLWPEGD